MKRVVDNPSTLDGLRVVQDGNEIMEALKSGESVMHWEWGYSLHPIIQDGEYCRIRPTDDKSVKVGDIVFCRFHMNIYMVHRCTEKYERDGKTYFKIEGTDNRFFGWTTDVFGIAEGTNVFQKNDFSSWV